MKQVVKNIFVINPYDPSSFNSCVYMIDTKSEEGLILIDVGLFIEPLRVIEKDGFNLKDIKHCLITHGHFDHFGACSELKKYNTELKFYAHELDTEKIEIKQDVSQYLPEYKYEPIELTRKIKGEDEILIIGELIIRCIHIPGHSPGSVAYYLETDEGRILFGGDLPGIALDSRGGNLKNYLKSMQRLLDFNSDLKIDILCEGHSDIIKPAEKVAKHIKAYMDFNEYLHLVAEVNPKDTETVVKLTKIAYNVEFYENALDFCNYLLEIDPENPEALVLLEQIKQHNPPKVEFLKTLIKESFDI
jgi:glyoxylase-like metal-dependent hydrolase (beta-lactamase superfamily II)